MTGEAEVARRLYERGIREMEAAQTQGRPVDERDRAIFLGTHADLQFRQGQLDEALRIRTEQQLPVYERPGDVRSLLVGRANLAMGLLRRDHAGDRELACEYLCQALEDAIGMQIPEAGQIAQILLQLRMRCEFIPAEIWAQMEAQMEGADDR